MSTHQTIYNHPTLNTPALSWHHMIMSYTDYCWLSLHEGNSRKLSFNVAMELMSAWTSYLKTVETTNPWLFPCWLTKSPVEITHGHSFLFYKSFYEEKKRKLRQVPISQNTDNYPYSNHLLWVCCQPAYSLRRVQDHILRKEKASTL